MSFRRRLFVAAVTGLSLAGSMTVVASPANAASKYGSCGSGWLARGRTPINNSSNSTDKLVGYVYWYVKSYPHSPSRVCVITRPLAKYTNVNHIMRASVKLYKSKSAVEVERSARYYVGPVTEAITDRYWVLGLIKVGGHVYSGVKWNLHS
ncbi:MAG: hypothetical protein JWN52_6233 [Actinomycetia bacterium]|nr:hypothetical protein [Actinomycetes bacterium]